MKVERTTWRDMIDRCTKETHASEYSAGAEAVLSVLLESGEINALMADQVRELVGCGWFGIFPVPLFDSKKLKGWAKSAHAAGWTPPPGWKP